MKSAPKIDPKSVKKNCDLLPRKIFVARQKQHFCQKINFKIDVAQKPDLIEQNQCDIRNQREKLTQKLSTNTRPFFDA